MFKYTVEYVDYDNQTRKKDLYFNLSKAEIIELEMTTPGLLSTRMQKVLNEVDQSEFIKLLKFLIVKSYGEKDPTGNRFIKNSEIVDSFLQTEAYSEFLLKLLEDSDFAMSFMIGMMPDLPDNVDKGKLIEAAKSGEMIDVENFVEEVKNSPNND